MNYEPIKTVLKLYILKGFTDGLNKWFHGPNLVCNL